MTDIVLPPMSRRSLELFYLFTSNRADAIEDKKFPTMIPYELFEEVSPNLIKRVNINAAISLIKPILKMYGFYITNVTNVGYFCHKSMLHTPAKFDRKFFGAKKINQVTQ
jgi:hypothetical protein